MNYPVTDTDKATLPNKFENEFSWAGAAGTFFYLDLAAKFTGVIMTHVMLGILEGMWTAIYANIELKVLLYLKPKAQVIKFNKNTWN